MTIILRRLSGFSLCSIDDVNSLGDHPYIMSAKGLGGWVQKMAMLADVQYYIYADIVGGSEKVKKYADII